MEKVRDEPITIEVYKNQIDMYLKMFCDEQNIENMKKESQGVWNACLMFIRQHVFYSDDVSIRVRCGNRYDDVDMLMAVCEYYIYLCYLYDKEVSIKGFCKLTGINVDTIFSWKNKEYRGLSTKSYSEIYKTLHDEREESLTGKLVTANRNPVGVLATLNHCYGWNVIQQPEKENKTLPTRTPEEIAASYGMDMSEVGKLPEPPED